MQEKEAIEFIRKHAVVPIEKRLGFPIILDRESKKPIVKAVFEEYGYTAIAGAVIGAITEGIVGSVAGVLGVPLLAKTIKGFVDYTRDVLHPLRKYFDFDVGNFVGLIGCKKDLDFSTGLKRAVDAKFNPIEGMEYGGPDYDTPDFNYFRLALRPITGLGKKDEMLLSRGAYDKDPREYTDKLWEKDILSVGGPIPIDPLFVKMKEKVLYCNFDLINEYKFFPDKPWKKYPIRTRDGREFMPEWNSFNLGLITKVDKKVVLEGGSGVFINIAGCNWQGTAGATSYFYQKEKLDLLLKHLEDNKALDKNFQVIVKVPLTEQGQPMLYKTKLLPVFTW